MRGLRPLLATAVAGAVIFALPAIASAGDLTLEVSGDCPGQLTLRWSGAEPNRPMAIIFALALGSYRVSNYPCSGTQLGLGESGLRLITVVGSRRSGSGSVSGQAQSDHCGGYLQLMVANGSGTPCRTSNVVQIPE